MAVPAAVAFLRQVQGVIESPELLKENNCIEEVVSYLDSTLDHPDSRVRLAAARSLAQLAAQLDCEDRGHLNLHQAPKVFEQLQRTSCEEDAELHSLLATVLGDEDGGSHKVIEKLANELPGGVREVFLSTGVVMDEAARNVVRQALVQLEGVVSVTFDLDWAVNARPTSITVGARSELVSDPTFVEDICTTAEDELQCIPSTEHGTIRVTPVSYDPRGRSVPIERTSVCADDDSDEEPMYLDDDSEGDEASATDCGSNDWFIINKHAGLFSNSKRVQEHADDPCLVARLQRARARQERQRREEKMRLRNVLAVITPLRAQTAGVATQRGPLASEMPGVE